MKKKWIVLICALVVVLVTIVTLSFTLFTVQTISVDFSSSVSHEYDNEKIIEASKIQKGKNIFFLKKNNFANNIEKAFPYLEVVNIETSFPSKLTIHLLERVGFYAIKRGDEYLLLDSKQKILEKTAEFSPSRTSPLLVKLGALPTEIVGQEGDFLALPFLTELYNGLLVNGKTLSDGLSLFREVEFFESENEVYHSKELGLILTMNSGRKVYLYNCAYGLKYKLAKFFAIVEDTLPKLGGILTDEQIANCEIHINNYQGSDYSEKDSYYKLVYEGETLSMPETA